jgi:maltose alpha-D-glucosyltransferase/alpha-amylase
MKNKNPDWLSQAVIYQVYPQSFCDSNGDGIGDLPGLISKLDYIKSLGANAIWLNPIYASPFGDAGYDVSDFFKVAPRYGTNADAERLFKEARKRGIRVVLDLVAGHTSDQHPWFLDATSNPDSPYRAYYIFTGDVPQRSMFKSTPTPVPGDVIDGYYVSNFLPFQPALNYGYHVRNPQKPWQRGPEHPDSLAIRCELRRIMQFWLDLGCDGFRVDMAHSLVKEDPQIEALGRLWQGYREWLDTDYPEAVLLAEWSDPKHSIPSGFHIDYFLGFGACTLNHLTGVHHELAEKYRRPHVYFERAGEGDIQIFLRCYLEHYTATRKLGYISVPTGNHDMQRIRRGRIMEELFVVYTMLLTLPGVPTIYYGDEIGMRHLEDLPEKEGSMWRTGNRTPMQWDAARPNLGFSTAKADQLYLPVDLADDAPTVAAQEEDASSLLHFVRTLTSLRSRYPALGNDADFRPLHALSDSPLFVYERFDHEQRLAVCLNPAEFPVSASVPQLAGAWALFTHGGEPAFEDEKLTLPGLSCAIFELESVPSNSL